MCGIAGEFVYSGARPAEVAAAPEMAARLSHRGPDGWGIFLDATRQALLIHTRLAIVDLAGGRQPLANETEDIWAIVNGELYGFEQQRAELQSRGHVFRTRCDSEVVLHLYEEHGDEFLKQLRGEFALAILDTRRRLLLLARDRFGIKPLYYTRCATGPRGPGESIVFGSEMKALLAHPGVAARLNYRSIHSMLSTIYPPRETIFEGLYQLEPATLLKVSAHGWEERRYWSQPRYVEPRELRDEAAAIEEFRDRLFEAIRLRLHGDVEVGAYLSGGIDSASVTCAAARWSHKPLKTFTIRFDNPRYDESAAARHVATAAGCEPYEFRIGPAELAPRLAESLWHSELPMMNGHGAAKFMLSQLARRHVKVVLSGEGADELLLGYPQFRHQELIEQQRCAPHNRGLRDRLNRFLREERSGFGIWRTRDYPEEATARRLFGAYPYPLIRYHGVRRIQRLVYSRAFLRQTRDWNPLEDLAKGVDREYLAGVPPLLATQYLMFRTDLPVYILNTLGDRSEMAHSIEARVPFLDHPLVEFVAGLPLHLRTRDGCCKYVLREAVRGLVPESVRMRKKQLFLSPSPEVLGLLGGPGSALADEFLSHRRTQEVGVLSPLVLQGIRRLLPLLPRSSRLYGMFEGLLVFLLSLHLLEEVFVRHPAAWAERFRRTQSPPQPVIPPEGAWLSYSDGAGQVDPLATGPAAAALANVCVAGAGP